MRQSGDQSPECNKAKRNLFEEITPQRWKARSYFAHAWAKNHLAIWDDRRTRDYATPFTVDDGLMIQHAALAVPQPTGHHYGKVQRESAFA